MAYCPKCGAPLEDGAASCPNCDAKSYSKSADIEDNRNIALLSYIGPLCFVPYFAAKRSPFAHYHAVRGLNLFILEGVYTVIETVLNAITRGVFGAVVSILLWLGWGFFIYLAVMGISHVIKGKKKNLPFIGTFRIVKN